MASSKEMVDYVCDQLSGAGEIRAKRMFGEWGLYCGGVYFGCVCDNQLFIKPTATLSLIHIYSAFVLLLLL